MSRGGTFGLFKRYWIPVLLTVVMAVGGYAVIRIRDTFRAEAVWLGGQLNAETPHPFNAKRVIYEITGTAGGSASINYLDEKGQPNLVDRVTLPWSFTIVTTLPSMSANVVAQASAEVGTLRCRVIVDGQVRDDRSGSEYEPFIYCLVKSV